MKWITLHKPDITCTRIYAIDNTNGLLSGLVCLLNAYIIVCMNNLLYDINGTLQIFNDDKYQRMIMSWNKSKRLWYDHIEEDDNTISNGLHIETLKLISHSLLNVNMKRHEKVVINDDPVYLNNLNINETLSKYEGEGPILVYAFLLTNNKSSSYNFGNFGLVFKNSFLQIKGNGVVQWVKIENGLQLAVAVSTNVLNIKRYLPQMKYMIFSLQFRAITPKQYSKFMKRRIGLLSQNAENNDDDEKVVISKTMIQKRRMIMKRKRTDSDTDNEST